MTREFPEFAPLFLLSIKSFSCVKLLLLLCFVAPLCFFFPIEVLLANAEFCLFQEKIKLSETIEGKLLGQVVFCVFRSCCFLQTVLDM